jgi:hypothetical protein
VTVESLFSVTEKADIKMKRIVFKPLERHPVWLDCFFFVDYDDTDKNVEI